MEKQNYFKQPTWHIFLLLVLFFSFVSHSTVTKESTTQNYVLFQKGASQSWQDVRDELKTGVSVEEIKTIQKKLASEYDLVLDDWMLLPASDINNPRLPTYSLLFVTHPESLDNIALSKNVSASYLTELNRKIKLPDQLNALSNQWIIAPRFPAAAGDVGAQSYLPLPFADQMAVAGQNHAGDALRAVANSQINAALTREVEEWLNLSGGKARVTADTGFGNSESRDFGLDFLWPIAVMESDILFTQMSAHRWSDRNIFNAGVGWRHTLNPHLMLGGNLFYDQDITRHHSRLGVGAEVWSDALRTSANYYIPLSGWRDSRDDIFNDDPLRYTLYERAARGWDVNVEALLAQNLSGRLGWFQWYGEKVDVNGSRSEASRNPHGVSVGLKWQPVPLLGLKAEQEFISGQRDNFSVGLNLNWQFGRTLSQMLSTDNASALASLAESRTEFVDRNNHIVLAYQQREKALRLYFDPTSRTTPVGVPLQHLAQGGQGGHIRYLSSDATVASADGQSGVVTPLKRGEVTITATETQPATGKVLGTARYRLSVLPGDFPPSVSDVTISGVVSPGNTLRGSYSYHANNGDDEALDKTDMRWLEKATGRVLQTGKPDYIVRNDDLTKTLVFRVTPVSKKGMSGEPVDAEISGSAVMNNLHISALLTPGEIKEDGSVLFITGSSAPKGAMLLQVEIQDQSGKPVSDQRVYWSSQNKLGTLSHNSQLTDSAGKSRVRLEGISSDGTDILSVSLIPDGVQSPNKQVAELPLRVAFATGTPTVMAVTLSKNSNILVGDSITATASVNNNGAPGVTTTYQWKRGGTAISGATGQSYTAVQADAGLALSVTATATSTNGNSGSLTSANTSAVLDGTPSVTAVTLSKSSNILVGDSITATATVSNNGAPDVSTTWQWKRGGTAISGATSQSYTVTNHDAGQALSVTATATSSNGNIGTLTSANTSAVLTGTPVVTAVTLSKTSNILVGDSLTATATVDNHGAAGVATTYQWKRGGTAISGATSQSYTATNNDAGLALSVTATATSSNGNSGNRTSASTDAVLSGSPTVTSVTLNKTTGVTVGDSLTATATVNNHGAPGVNTTYQWKRGGNDISGATGQSYTATNNDAGLTLSVTATATSSNGNSGNRSSVSTDAVLTGTPAVTAVTLSKTSNILVGDSITATATVSNNGAPGVNTTYQWKRGGNDISGATGQSYTATNNDAGLALSVTATATSSNGSSGNRTSASTDAVLSGTPAVTAVTLSKTSNILVGDRITATATVSNGGAPGVDTTYQWKRGGSNIGGATGQNYTATNNDVGLPLSVTVTATSSNGNSGNRTSTSTDAVLSGTPAVTAVTLSKTSNILVGDSITATATVDNNGAPGVTTTYQWKRGGTNISGATGQSYTTAQADAGLALSVTVTARSSNGRENSRTSANTSAVLATPTVTAVTLSKTSNILVGDSITATATVSNNGAPGVTTTYQWKRGGNNISGATGQSYTAAQADAGLVLSVTVTARSSNGRENSRTSANTSAVLATPTVTAVTLSKTSNILVGDSISATATVSNNGAPGVTTTYQWKRGGNNISGATGQSYIAAQADAGLALSVNVTARSSNGRENSRTSANTSAVLATPTVTALTLSKTSNILVGDSITATATVSNNGAPGVTTTYQWKRGGTNISGATGQSYIAAQADAGLALSVTVTARSSNGRENSRTSANTSAVLATPTVTAVTLSKTSNILVGDSITATATVSNNGAPGVTITYQWKRGGTNISGATGQSYTAAQADAGLALSVTVTARSSNGRENSRTSANTSAVLATPTVTALTLSKTSNILVGDSITATATVSNNGAPGVTTTYQWKRGGTNISGATGQSYIAAQADAGLALSVTVTARSSNGRENSRTSANTSVVLATPTVTAVTLSKTSNILVGDSITATATVSNNGAPGVTTTYQWKRGGNNISGATGQSYIAAQADAGLALSVTVTARSSNGRESNRTSTNTSEVLTGTPSVTFVALNKTGGVIVGDRLTATATVNNNGAPGVTTTYQWMRGGTAISSATGPSYTVVQADVGLALSVTATATSSNGNRGTLTSASTSVVLTGTPSVTAVTLSRITGVIVGDSVTATATVDNNGAPGVTTTYQWRSGVSNISGATGRSYTARTTDVGSALSVMVTATSSNGRSHTRLSANVDPVLSGIPVVTSVTLSKSSGVIVGDNLSARVTVNNHGAPGVTTRYQWKRGNTAISGATGQSYTAIQGDVGATLSVTATAISTNGNSGSMTSANTAPVLTPPTPSIVSMSTSKRPLNDSVTIVGDTRTVTATVYNNGAPGVTTRYQWMRGNANISGATGQSYTVVLDDVGSVISVTVTAESTNGRSDSGTLRGSSPVLSGTPTVNSVAVNKTSNVVQNDHLTASASVSNNGAPGVTTSYQWKRGNSNISGATDQSYTATSADVGNTLSVTATARSTNGRSESRTSASTNSVIGHSLRKEALGSIPAPLPNYTIRYWNAWVTAADSPVAGVRVCASDSFQSHTVTTNNYGLAQFSLTVRVGDGGGQTIRLC